MAEARVRVVQIVGLADQRLAAQRRDAADAWELLGDEWSQARWCSGPVSRNRTVAVTPASLNHDRTVRSPTRQILLPHNASRSKVRPEQFERRARLVSAIARGRRWLDDVVSGRVTTVAELCTRENCSVRQVNMAISLAFLAPNLVKAAVEGRLPRGIGIERLRDPPTEWSRQFQALGLNPE
jgi:hypothetical protein